MNYRGKKDVRVFNECPFQVNLVGQRRDYIFPPCLDGEPTMNFVDFEEIEYAHSRGNVFTTGLLQFSEEDREGMYEALGIKDWRNKVWFNADIEDIIMNPTVQKMQRVIEITNVVVLERVRGMMVRFVNEKRNVSQNVINIINARYREIAAGNMSSKIIIQKADVERYDVDEVSALKKELEEMKALMKQMTSGNAVRSDVAQASDAEKSGSTTTDTSTPVQPAKRTTKKAATRK